MDHLPVRRLLAVSRREWSDAERDQVEAHLRECADCAALARAYFAQERLLARLPQPAMSAAQQRDVLTRALNRTNERRLRARAANALGLTVGLLTLGLLVIVLILSRRGEAGVGTLAGTTPGPGVADMLRDPPQPGEAVEVDAYFSGAGAMPMLGIRAISNCPTTEASALTDQPFLATVFVLSTASGNPLPDDAPWLVAALPKATQLSPRIVNVSELPYRARFRGHMGDPTYADCPHADRIFVIDEVVAVYQAQPPESVTHPLKLPADYAAWPRYYNADFGYSLPYPSDWTVEQVNDPDVLSAITLRSPSWPDLPVRVRVHAGETHLDQYDPASTPPLLQHGMGRFEQGLFGDSILDSQHLTGYLTWPEAQPGRSSIAVLFSGSGHTYEIALNDYPLGFDAPQSLLTIYSALVEGFRLDAIPGPTPTPPVKQSLGSGPFLSQDEALARLHEQQGDFEFLSARLMSEAEARSLSDCGIEGHPDGVWFFNVRGFFEGATRTLRLFLDATTGQQLCGEEIAPTATPLPTLPPGVTATPASTLAPGVTATPAPPTVAPSPTPIDLNVKYTNLQFRRFTDPSSVDTALFSLRVAPGTLVTCEALDLPPGAFTDMLLMGRNQEGLAAGDTRVSKVAFTDELYLYVSIGQEFRRSDPSQELGFYTYSLQCMDMPRNNAATSPASAPTAAP